MERRLIVMRVEELAESVAITGGGLILNLTHPVDAYGPEWHMAGHTLMPNPSGDGSWMLSMVFERRD